MNVASVNTARRILRFQNREVEKVGMAGDNSSPSPQQRPCQRCPAASPRAGCW